MDKDEFEFNKSIVDWLVQNGVFFLQAMAIVSLANKSQRSIFDCYIDFQIDQEKKE